jgi:plastocyanin
LNLQAAFFVVGVGTNNSDTFTPAVANITAGDSVIWNWLESNALTTHNSVSTNVAFLWNSGTHPKPFSFTNAFPNAGTFPYQCTIHVTFGMTGSVVVTGGNQPPTVTVTNPANGTVYASPANVTVRTSASDTDGTVTNVQFRVDGNVLTNKTAAPFSAVTNNLAVGSHTLVAIASDNNGATATNQVTISVVTPAPMTFTAPMMVPPGKFRFTYAANTGLNYVVQRSTNLLATGWTPLITNTAAGSSINFTDVTATTPYEFYRVGRLPNP